MSASSFFPDPLASEPGRTGTGAAFGETQSLYRKYRPQSFDAVELVGQESVVRTLRNAIRLDRVAHAYLFAGPRGTGKTTTARLLAKAVNCLDPDVDARPCNRCAACVAINTGATTDIIEIDAASNRGIDDIRELRERVKFAPTFLKTKFYIVDEAHQITGAAANAFLKTLEEPPPHTKFILATTDPEQLLLTIVSRCQRFDFKRFTRQTIVEHLARVASQEGVSIDPEALAVIGEHASGSMRDALSLLDQLASYQNPTADLEPRPIDAGDVRSLLGIARSERVFQLAHALASGDVGTGLALINAAFESGEDPRQLNRQLVALLRATMFQVAAQAPGEEVEVNRLADRFSLSEIARHAARFSEIDYRIRHASLPQLPLEIAFVQAALDGDAQRPVKQPSLEASSHSPGESPLEVSRPPARVANALPRTAVPEAAPRVSMPSRQPDADLPRPNRQIPAAPPPAPTSEGAITVDRLHDLWPKIRLDIKARDRRIEALLSSCDPAAVNGTAITLVTSYKFHWERMNEDASKQLVESVIGRLVNEAVSVTTEMRGASGAGVTQPSAPQGAESETVRPAVTPSHTPEARTPEDESVIEAARNIFDLEELTPRA